MRDVNHKEHGPMLNWPEEVLSFYERSAKIRSVQEYLGTVKIQRLRERIAIERTIRSLKKV